MSYCFIVVSTKSGSESNAGFGTHLTKEFFSPR